MHMLLHAMHSRLPDLMHVLTLNARLLDFMRVHTPVTRLLDCRHVRAVAVPRLCACPDTICVPWCFM